MEHKKLINNQKEEIQIQEEGEAIRIEKKGKLVFSQARCSENLFINVTSNSELVFQRHKDESIIVTHDKKRSIESRTKKLSLSRLIPIKCLTNHMRIKYGFQKGTSSNSTRSIHLDQPCIRISSEETNLSKFGQLGSKARVPDTKALYLGLLRCSLLTTSPSSIPITAWLRRTQRKHTSSRDCTKDLKTALLRESSNLKQIFLR